MACNKICKLAGCSNPVVSCEEDLCQEHFISECQKPNCQNPLLKITPEDTTE
jgi:hypothetical protein